MADKKSSKTSGAKGSAGKKNHYGTTKHQRSEIAKTAKKGKNVFGGGFDKVAKKAGAEYHSKEAGKRVAASIMFRKAAKLGKFKGGKKS